SRRRHTRFSRDWSSDVCSSDLGPLPLFVVDDEIMEASFDPMSIDAASIAKIEILKDADATALYGSRGANGVIVITTKEGLQKQRSEERRVGKECKSSGWPQRDT